MGCASSTSEVIQHQKIKKTDRPSIVKLQLHRVSFSQRPSQLTHRSPNISMATSANTQQNDQEDDNNDENSSNDSQLNSNTSRNSLPQNDSQQNPIIPKLNLNIHNNNKVTNVIQNNSTISRQGVEITRKNSEIYQQSNNNNKRRYLQQKQENQYQQELIHIENQSGYQNQTEANMLLNEIDHELAEYKVTEKYLNDRKSFREQMNYKENPAPFISASLSSSKIMQRRSIFSQICSQDEDQNLI